jgi:alkanesulfonate monooxygenase SsuD/methylene tetrahydromethanopterin reductase-like flavin-dependent oxidoreductase (luciferase family)
VAGYRQRFEPSDRLAEPRVILGVAAIASDSEERAEALARANDLAMVRLMQNRPGPVPTPEEAAAHDWTDQERQLAAQRRRFMSVGTPDQVRDDLERRRTYADADELIITTQIHDEAERELSYELIAKAYSA